jgi:hypothetical protein
VVPLGALDAQLRTETAGEAKGRWRDLPPQVAARQEWWV